PINLIYGGNFNIFRPRTVPYDHEQYGLEVLKQQFRYFGPEEIAIKNNAVPLDDREIFAKDKVFIGKIVKMDWRDRPTARKILANEWF
ncbi:hypothetical protein I7I51_04360, partial [Histoplasma capsulatum]